MYREKECRLRICGSCGNTLYSCNRNKIDNWRAANNKNDRYTPIGRYDIGFYSKSYLESIDIKIMLLK